MDERIRQPAVAGLFYPSDPGELQGMLDVFFAAASMPGEETPPKAVIVPHAGFHPPPGKCRLTVLCNLALTRSFPHASRN